MTLKLYGPAFLLWTSLTLIGCGGGGGADNGGSGSDYTGVTTPAVIDRDNAGEMAETAWLLIAQGGGPVTAYSATDSDNVSAGATPGLTGLTEALRKGVDALSQSGDGMVPRTRQTNSETIACDTGSIDATVTGDDVTGEVVGTLDYNDCVLFGTRYFGVVRFDGALNARQDAVDLSFDYVDFMAEGSQSLTLNGVVVASIYLYQPRILLIIDVLTRNNATGDVFKAEDYAVDITEYNSAIEMTISGKVFHPDYGYGVVTTIAPLRLAYDSPWPYSGQYLVTGDRSSLRATCINEGEYVLEVDENGDGIYDSTTTEHW